MHAARRNPQEDVSFSVALNGQYDLLRTLTMRFAHNMLDTNNSIPSPDYTNTRSFLSLDYLASERYATHLILRSELNRFDSQDGTQSYSEAVTAVSFVSNF